MKENRRQIVFPPRYCDATSMYGGTEANRGASWCQAMFIARHWTLFILRSYISLNLFCCLHQCINTGTQNIRLGAMYMC